LEMPSDAFALLFRGERDGVETLALCVLLHCGRG